jgi:hypothetical protein
MACSPATCPHLEVVVVGGVTYLQWGASGYEHWYVSENGVKHDLTEPAYTQAQLEKGEPPYQYAPPPMSSQTIHYQVWVANHPENKSNEVTIMWP